MTTHLGHCQSTKTTESHSRPALQHWTCRATLPTQSLVASLLKGLLSTLLALPQHYTAPLRWVHNITLFVEFEITIVPESVCGLLIDQHYKILPVIVIPCVCFGTPQSVWFAHFCFQPVKVCVCITVEPEAESACHDDLRHARQSVWQLRLHIHFRQCHYGLFTL
jgi:hypothetical protein